MRPLRVLPILLLLVAASAHALDVPPPPARWVTDRANILSTTQIATLDTKLQNFEQSSGAQFIIYILPSIGNDSIEEFTIRAAERWRVGQKKYDNGLILFVFLQERKARVEVGYGLEGSITDAFSSRVIREVLAPRFQQGDYAGGLNAAADALMQKIRTGEEPVAPLNPSGGGAQQQQPRGARRGGGIDIGTIVFIAILFIFFILPMFGRRRRRGGCGGCFFPFIFPGGGITFGGGGWSGGGGGWSSGGGGFSGGGGGFGGGGATGGW